MVSIPTQVQTLLGTDAKTVKCRNLTIDPYVILSIEDTERNERGFQRHLVIPGTATLEDSEQTPGEDKAGHAAGQRSDGNPQ